ncbi:uncharacterized protein J7T54_007009 [Emericellopsis cladophorae]|uniref:Uncharacterized protein n=1 Tax=Emericellopsis cladophorae TaxID=2686198 RepID=A0A9P9Y899_9HYPO|nr:uncharacterized protein J7T54_007009 [Emericellopsis cladophorae]KAI6785367.1 hypothetical protein J7T54_007009 [Emericellopsis cladophorae]
MAHLEPNAKSATHDKLPCIPEGYRVRKRPLTRSQPPSSANARIIYMSTRTPFMATITRIRKTLLHSPSQARSAPKNASLESRIAYLEKNVDEGQEQRSVTVVGTGRAIEKVVGVAGWFDDEPQFGVEMRTKSIGAVDDIVPGPDENDDNDDNDGGIEEESSRVRRVSALEVTITLR